MVEHCRVVVLRDRLLDTVVEVANLGPEVNKRLVVRPVRLGELEHGFLRHEGAHDAEPVAKLNRLDLVDVADEDEQL